MRALCVVSDVLEGGKTRPVYQVLMLGSAPILSEKTVAVANYLGIKVRSELRPVIRQTSDSEITTES
jgi:hypothetical protein